MNPDTWNAHLDGMPLGETAWTIHAQTLPAQVMPAQVMCDSLIFRSNSGIASGTFALDGGAGVSTLVADSIILRAMKVITDTQGEMLKYLTSALALSSSEASKEQMDAVLAGALLLASRILADEATKLTEEER